VNTAQTLALTLDDSQDAIFEGNVIAGGTAQSAARIKARANADSFEFGHENQAGYSSTIGAGSNNGFPHIAFFCINGTNNNTFETLGIAGQVIQANTNGTLTFNKVTTATADNQALTQLMSLDNAGNLTTISKITGSEFEATVLGANTDPGADDARFGGYGILGARSSFYVSNVDGAVVLNHAGLHSVNTKLTTTITGVTVTGSLSLSDGGVNGVIKAASGNYGSISVSGAAGSSGLYAGYSINDRVVFMNNGSTTSGIYNDTNNEWFMTFIENGSVNLYHNNLVKLATTSVGVTVTGTGTGVDWVATSDERLKKDVEPILPEDALKTVMSLEPCTHEWIDEEKPEGRFNAFIAQQVQAIDSSLVNADEEGVLAVNYMKAVPILTGAIQAQQVQIDELKVLVATLMESK
jgi:hypothetical protein